MNHTASSKGLHEEDDRKPLIFLKKIKYNIVDKKDPESSMKTLNLSSVKVENMTGCVEKYNGNCKIVNIKEEIGGGASVKEEVFRDDERSLDKAGYSAIVYGCINYLQKIVKSWSNYEASLDNEFDDIRLSYPTLEIRIPAEYVTSSNRQVTDCQLWGTDLYTNDSDIIAVLVHTGYFRPPPFSPIGMQEFRVTVAVLPPKAYYRAMTRNDIRSRACAGASVGCSIRIDRCCLVNKDGGIINIEPQLNQQYSPEPTIAPALERSLKREGAAKDLKKHQQPSFVQKVPVLYNLCNEPWLKYSITVVADKGLKKPLYTSTRLTKGEVLYLETHTERYELSYTGYNGTEPGSLVPVFRWARCKKILFQEDMLTNGIPFHAEDLEVIADNIEWEDLQWSQEGVLIKDKMYSLARAHFLGPKL